MHYLIDSLRMLREKLDLVTPDRSNQKIEFIQKGDEE